LKTASDLLQHGRHRNDPLVGLRLPFEIRFPSNEDYAQLERDVLPREALHFPPSHAGLDKRMVMNRRRSRSLQAWKNALSSSDGMNFGMARFGIRKRSTPVTGFDIGRLFRMAVIEGGAQEADASPTPGSSWWASFHDRVSRARVDPVYLCGGAVPASSVPLRLFISRTEA
jgi:hypothetical protein